MRKNRIIALICYVVFALAITMGLVAPLLISNNVLPVFVSLGLGLGYFVGLFYLSSWVAKWALKPKDVPVKKPEADPGITPCTEDQLPHEHHTYNPRVVNACSSNGPSTYIPMGGYYNSGPTVVAAGAMGGGLVGDLGDMAVSALVTEETGSELLGTLAGGSFVGAMIGEELRDNHSATSMSSSDVDTSTSYDSSSSSNDSFSSSNNDSFLDKVEDFFDSSSSSTSWDDTSSNSTNW